MKSRAKFANVNSPLKYITCWLLVLLANNRLAYKNFPASNTLAYYVAASVTKKKVVYALTSMGQCYKTFLSVIYEFFIIS